MGATAALNKAVLGLGLVIGVAQTASAQTYVGTYSGADHGNITIQIDANGAVSCSLASAAGNGNYAGKGGVVQQTPSLVFTCDHNDFPNYLSVSGNNVHSADTLTGQYATAATGSGDIKQGSFTAKISTGGGVNTGQLSPQAISGEWYDPAYNGSGFNFLVAVNGFFAHYYGRSAKGEMLWLVTTEVPAGNLKTNTKYTLMLGTTNSGTFAKPTLDLAHWGQLDITFSSCTNATATLSGKDGVQNLNLQRLGAIGGVSGC